MLTNQYKNHKNHRIFAKDSKKIKAYRSKLLKEDNLFEISLCSFAFENAALIQMLKERGEIIRNNNLDDLQDINDKI